MYWRVCLRCLRSQTWYITLCDTVMFLLDIARICYKCVKSELPPEFARTVSGTGTRPASCIVTCAVFKNCYDRGSHQRPVRTGVPMVLCERPRSCARFLPVLGKIALSGSVAQGGWADLVACDTRNPPPALANCCRPVLIEGWSVSDCQSAWFVPPGPPLPIHTRRRRGCLGNVRL